VPRSVSQTNGSTIARRITCPRVKYLQGIPRDMIFDQSRTCRISCSALSIFDSFRRESCRRTMGASWDDFFSKRERQNSLCTFCIVIGPNVTIIANNTNPFCDYLWELDMKSFSNEYPYVDGTLHSRRKHHFLSAVL
jgi:hypothetical protein